MTMTGVNSNEKYVSNIVREVKYSSNSHHDFSQMLLWV